MNFTTLHSKTEKHPTQQLLYFYKIVHHTDVEFLCQTKIHGWVKKQPRRTNEAILMNVESFSFSLDNVTALMNEFPISSSFNTNVPNPTTSLPLKKIDIQMLNSYPKLSFRGKVTINSWRENSLTDTFINYTCILYSYELYFIIFHCGIHIRVFHIHLIHRLCHYRRKARINLLGILSIPIGTSIINLTHEEAFIIRDSRMHLHGRTSKLRHAGTIVFIISVGNARIRQFDIQSGLSEKEGWAGRNDIATVGDSNMTNLVCLLKSL